MLFTGAVARAHGGLSIEEDTCKFRVGPYSLHFAGYQPDTTEALEFCKDIPATGRTVVVLDFIDRALRDLPMEVRLIRDTGANDELGAITLLHKLPDRYPTGSLTWTYDFNEPGQFIGLVKVGERGEYVARFPFAVGQGKDRPWMSALLLLILSGLGGFALYVYSGKHRGSRMPRKP